MKKTIYLLLTLFIISCGDNSDYIPTDKAIFGFNLEQFSKEKLQKYGNGECWGTLQEYSKDEIKIVADNLQCSDYNSSEVYLLFKNDKINTAHSVFFETVWEEETKNKRFSAIESIYNFSSIPPTIFRRTEVLDKQNLALLTTNFDTLNMENVEAKYGEFTNRLQIANSQMLKEGEILVALTQGEVTVDKKKSIPKMDIFMTSSIFGKTILLANDFNLNQIDEPEKRKKFEIPKDAIFAFYSWFAGNGSFYYGIIENDNLVVFRKILKEQETQKLPFEIFKKFPITNSIE